MTWLRNNLGLVAELTWAHLWLVIPAVLAAVLIAVPVAYLAVRQPRGGQPVLSVLTLLYAVPSLPLIVVIPAIFGTGLRSNATIVIALTAYGIALLVRSASDAFAAVDADTRLSARAVGFNRRQMFTKVDLPLAIPVIVSGVRVVAVSTISLATIGALVGISSLGSLITDGFTRAIVIEVLAGIVMTVVLAVVVDLIIVAVGRMLTPWEARR
ncbi:ABC transporter permease [Corynebacterium doosanense]|uniref:ABC transporter permease n=1 Tax=Corynebacterium doosanense CAU 212 = DSM 45436 TaxID=558173 RepID=A0A097IET7_9CORY|nr:ABC transporter permease [Corynebacterium doosanense]AIT60641.1 ABC transporter permease [Corynebacterium doosanense CAU 212 = DSM 45436]